MRPGRACKYSGESFMKARIPFAIALGVVLLAACGGGDSGGDMSGPAAPEMYGPPGMQNAAEHRVAASGPAIKRIDSRLRSAHGQVSVWVSLDQASVAAAQAAVATAAGLESAKMSTDAAVTSTMKRA